MNALFSNSGGNIYAHNFSSLNPNLPVGHYKVMIDGDGNVCLRPINNPAAIPTKLYGNAQQIADRIVDAYVRRPNKQMGVLLTGLRGSGKTMTANIVADRMIKAGISVLHITTTISGSALQTFLNNLTSPVVVCFDEFEKHYDEDDQVPLLSILDGSIGGGNLYVILANSKEKIRSEFFGRPDRARYHFSYGGLSGKELLQIVTDNLKRSITKEEFDDIVAELTGTGYDSIMTLIDELDFNPRATVKDALSVLNIQREYAEFGLLFESSISLVRGLVISPNSLEGNPSKCRYNGVYVYGITAESTTKEELLTHGFVVTNFTRYRRNADDDDADAADTTKIVPAGANVQMAFDISPGDFKMQDDGTYLATYAPFTLRAVPSSSSKLPYDDYAV